MLPGRYLIKSLGCKANLFDAQLIEAELESRGWLPAAAEEMGLLSLCIVNSCTVTDEADRQSRRLASRFAREFPNARVVVTGCAAEIDPERIARTPGIHYVIGNRDKPEFVDLILKALETTPAMETKRNEAKAEGGEVLGSARGYDEILSRHRMDREWPLSHDPRGSSYKIVKTGEKARHTEMTRAFLKVQEGCNSFCTYCIIPYGRGPSRSLKPREVLESIRSLIARGAREVVLTATNLGDYGADWGPGQSSLTELVELILSETRLERLRLSSLDPTEIHPSLLSLMEGEARLCPHFHVSLQSPHPRILRLMKRRYGFEEVSDCLNQIANLGLRCGSPPGGVFVGMDVITGFPGETSEEFDWGVQRLRELPWTRLHVFPYSERSGTPATRLSGSIPAGERKRRAKILCELSLERMKEHHQKLLGEFPQRRSLEGVLLERAIKPPTDVRPGQVDRRSLSWASGYTPNYVKVYAPIEPMGDPTGELRNQTVNIFPHTLHLDRVNGDVALIGEVIQ